MGDVPRVCSVMPPVSPLPPPGSSPWWLHQEPVPALVVGGDVDVFSARLLGGEAPSVDVVGTFLLLIRIGAFLLQLLPFVFRPPVLEPDFYLGERERRALAGGSRHSRPRRGTALQPGSKLSFPQTPIKKKSLSLQECSHRHPALPRFPLCPRQGGMGGGQTWHIGGCGVLPPLSSASLRIPALEKPKTGEGRSIPPQTRGQQAHGTLLRAAQPGAHHPGVWAARSGEVCDGHVGGHVEPSPHLQRGPASRARVASLCLG